MEWETFSTDQLESQLIANRQARSRLDASDMEILKVLDQRQVATADGCRSLSQWLSARLDVGLDTAKTMVRTMRRTEARPALREALACGEASLDRIAALSRIPDDIGLLDHLDIAGVRAEAARSIRLTAEECSRFAGDRFLVMQPSLDESWWKIWGGLDGVSGSIVDKVLTESADQLPALPDGTRGASSWRKATALVELCVSDEASPAQVTVFVDAKTAGGTSGESGVFLEAGPRVGLEALEAILCHTTTEVIARTESGRLMEYGTRVRTAPPALKRALIYRDGNMCAADGCDSRYRLEPHHKIPWSEGGPTDPGNLTTLCSLGHPG